MGFTPIEPDVLRKALFVSRVLAPAVGNRPVAKSPSETIRLIITCRVIVRL